LIKQIKYESIEELGKTCYDAVFTKQGVYLRIHSRYI